MKRCIAAITAAVLLISLCTSCSESGHSLYKEIYKRYSSIESFYSEAEITVENARSKNKYRVRQRYDAPNVYTLAVDEPEDIAGSGYIFRGEQTVLKSGFGDEIVMTSFDPETKNCFFISDFFAAYYEGEASSAVCSEGISGGKVSLECSLDASDGTQLRQTLVLDEETLLPIKLVTYDANGKARVTVSFKSFKLNTDTNDIEF